MVDVAGGGGLGRSGHLPNCPQEPAMAQPVRPAPSPIAPDAPALPQESARAGTANPASTYCLQRGGQLEFSTRSGGGEVGICVSPGGDECEEWAFLRGSCAW
ncbi:putative hemolysin [Ralstonia pseudosolanacearum]|uniref:putative hemolysin n=1 Tax=Ralstonia pseudosolanacearum TaxID=1310165 RepID=UPI003CF86A38